MKAKTEKDLRNQALREKAKVIKSVFEKKRSVRYVLNCSVLGFLLCTHR